MIYSALLIRENRVVEMFDSDKHTKKEFKEFTEKYPSKDGYCIAHHAKEDNN